MPLADTCPLRRVYSGIPLSRRVAGETRDTAARKAAHNCAGRLSRDRRRADRHLSAPFTRRMEHYRANATSAFRCDTGAGRAVRAGIECVLWRSAARNSKDGEDNRPPGRAAHNGAGSGPARPSVRSEFAPGGALDLSPRGSPICSSATRRRLALLEITLGGVRLRFDDARASPGAEGISRRASPGPEFPAGRPAFVRQGEELEVRRRAKRLPRVARDRRRNRCPVVLGSRSTDLRSGFGGCKGAACGMATNFVRRRTAPATNGSRGSRPGALRRSGRRPRCAMPILRVVRGANGTNLSRRRRQHF